MSDQVFVSPSSDFPAFPEGSMNSYHAAYGGVVASLVTTVATLLGHEVNTSALVSVATMAAITSLGNKASILAAIVANAATIFPDDKTRSTIVKVLNGLMGLVAA